MVPEPVNIDSSFIQKGLIVSDMSLEAKKREKKTTESAKVESEPRDDDGDSGHPLFDLTTISEDYTAFDDYPIGTKWRIR
jgi:hypothetical protein